MVLKAAPNIQVESIRRTVEDTGRRCEGIESSRDLDMVQGYLEWYWRELEEVGIQKHWQNSPD